VRLVKQGTSDDVADTLPTARIQLVRDVKRRIEQQSGLTARFAVTDMAMPKPNAFSTSDDKGNLVAINIAMLNLLGDDADALAAVIGHEYAHLALEHRKARATRESVRVGVSAILGAILGRYGVPAAGTLTDVGTSMISTTFSRDEERDADEKGISYAAAAGYSVEGGIRAWERMSSSGSGGSIPFLSTHPAPAERIETMRKLALQYPQAPVASTAPVPEPDPEAVSIWSFAGREMLKWRGITLVEEEGAVRVFDLSAAAGSALQIGDVVSRCSLPAAPIHSVAEFAACHAASNEAVVYVDVVRSAEPVRLVMVSPQPTVKR